MTSMKTLLIFFLKIRKEVFELLRTDYKCELQALYAVGPYGLSHFLMKKLPEYI